MPEVSIRFASSCYKVIIGGGVLARVGKVIAEISNPTGVAVITNPTIARYYSDIVLSSLADAGLKADIIIVPAGERYKSLNTVSRIYSAMLKARMDRRSAILALGGGVIGDMAGFAAATYMRGIDFYQAPTTLLAMVDSSVGGKTGVDLPEGKNLVGAFYQPRAVFADIDTLRTLPARELRAGLAEVVKHGIIWNREFFDFLVREAENLLRRKADVLQAAVTRSVEIKRDVVQQDEREAGIRAILNYGHTVAHALEVLCGYGRYRHGEAISIGMVTEAILAEREGIAEQGLARTVASGLSAMRLPVEMDSSVKTEDILMAIELDKKTLGGKFRLALPVKLGECKIVDGISREALGNAIEVHRVWER